MKRNLLNSIKLTRPKKNVFDLSHDVKLSCNMGQLVPVMCTEAVPGDKVTLGAESLIRFAPMVAPVMHRFDVSVHYFFVPWRILWPNWEKYITNTKDPITGQLPAFPFITLPQDGSKYTKLCDYLGIPPAPADAETGVDLSALPFAAYQKIYDEYYRDQNLVTPVFQPLIDGAQASDLWLRQLRTRAWEHDMFTAALPFAQKGDPVTIPIAGFEDVPVVQDEFIPGGAAGWDAEIDGGPGTTPVNVPIEDLNKNPSYLYAKTSEMEAQSATINDLRKAFALQRWLEKAARGGTRYFESILMHFGLRSPDARLQRPEYITGIKSPIAISEVLNTAGEAGGRPQGDMAGHGVGVAGGKFGNYFCQEHGYIMGIMSVMPKTAYQQGVPRHFLKFNDPTEIFFPDFAHLGEQPVYNQELYAYQSNPYEPFGYLPRYYEYKFENNRVAGDFRTSLNFWHEGRIFDGPPALNQAFIECNPRYDIFAVDDPDVDHLWCHILNRVKMVRPMPMFGTPSII